MIPFGKWSPDNYGVNSGLAGEASGVLPGTNSYHPFPQLAVASAAANAAGRGAFMARTTANAAAIFVGSAAKLEKYASLASWSDFTAAAGAYSLATDDIWQFAQFGDVVFATQITDALQSVTLTGGTQFAAASGSPPKARYIAVVGEFLMLANTDTSAKEVRWSGRNDATHWTKGKKDADAQTFPDGGDIMGLIGFENGGLVFQTDTIRHVYARQDAAIFEFHRNETVQGTLAPYSIVPRRGAGFYYGVNGFQRIGYDGNSEPIGAKWIDDWFLATSNVATRPKAIVGAPDPTCQRIFWLFALNGNATSSIFDHVLCYDPDTVDSNYGPWTHASLSASYIFPAATAATTLENLGSAGLGYTLDGVPYSLDADIWKGGAPRLGVFDSAFKMNFPTGSPMAAVLQTGQFEPVPGKRGYIRGFRLIGDAASASGRVGTSERSQDAIAWGASQSLKSNGAIEARSSGRFTQVEASIPQATSYTHLAGIDFDDDHITPDGRR